MALGATLWADGSGDNNPATVRPVPAPGIEVPAEVQQRLARACDQLDQQLAALGENQAARLPDVQIFSRAVRTALEHNEFFDVQDLVAADELVAEGQRRVMQLANESADWTQATGLVVRGYRSKIDHTVQPYGLVIPQQPVAGKYRLDVWFHGRGEKLSEVNFLAERRKRVGEFAPPGTIVLHPYGRYCNAFKFAGETDVLEAIEAVRREYPIDEDRISVRGFSMGGAACWQFAVHYADRWFAANPGAGFSETPEFLATFQQEELQPTPYERKLWRWYDCPGYSINLLHCPTIAYSGELDRQKQAADVMQAALAQEGIDLLHVIGPQTQHSIHPSSKQEIERRMSELSAAGRQRMPRRVEFATFTLKYNRLHWVSVEALQEHWEPARVTAAIEDAARVEIKTQNVTALSLNVPAGDWPEDIRTPVTIVIDGHELLADRPRSDRSWQCSLVRTPEGAWQVGVPAEVLRKRPGLQGPIDDALMDSFIFVRPTVDRGDPAPVDSWVEAELQHAISAWRTHFRGDARVKNDDQITDDDVRDANLVLFGTPRSNVLVGKILDQLPITWTEKVLRFGARQYDARTTAPILIYPNPLNANRYVVLNSGFTFREYAYLNNARQVPMLPDWAAVDVTHGATSQYPGNIQDAGFFDEAWQLRN